MGRWASLTDKEVACGAARIPAHLDSTSHLPIHTDSRGSSKRPWALRRSQGFRSLISSRKVPRLWLLSVSTEFPISPWRQGWKAELCILIRKGGAESPHPGQDSRGTPQRPALQDWSWGFAGVTRTEPPAQGGPVCVKPECRFIHFQPATA